MVQLSVLLKPDEIELLLGADCRLSPNDGPLADQVAFKIGQANPNLPSVQFGVGLGAVVDALRTIGDPVAARLAEKLERQA